MIWTALIASLVAAAVTALGILAIRARTRWARENAAYFASFAAGVLIAVSLVHLVPEALGRSPRAPGYLLLGYFALYGIDRAVRMFVCTRHEDARDLAVGLVPMIGIGLHSLVDGTVYAITFRASVFTGVLSAIGMVLHEFPEGIVTYVMLLRGGIEKKRAALYAFLAAGLTTPLGAAIASPAVAVVEEDLLGALLALSAGALLYVGATHLLPHAEHEGRRFSVLALGAGLAVALAITLVHG